MAFKFSYQKVLDFKEREKEFAKQEYGSVKLRQLELEEQLDGLAMEKDKVFNQYNDVDRKKVSDLQTIQQEMEHVNRKMKQLQAKSEEIHLEVEQKHQVLIERLQEVKMWNQWRKKSRAAFQKQMDQKEQALLDEMAVLRYSHKV
ncbi:flagellar FliJ family protein [Neobacillus sp. OS1-32]|jgi:flagellar FliJ protein|uniref:flagellar export protein FliJ n=1 Tax=Neobacillus sp. OS1-32 TaxID=3070682 RepID=UPI0027E1B70C|nr:flagellar FliJ family protein [Neobacillus sp. OS1-32]WML31525.1 flagellar FliJ family protein [Neobacillus sp. OS1-32]